MLSAIYEQDFLPCSFDQGRRPSRAGDLNEVIAGSKTGWVLEADLKNFFGSCSITIGCSDLLSIELETRA